MINVDNRRETRSWLSCSLETEGDFSRNAKGWSALLSSVWATRLCWCWWKAWYYQPFHLDKNRRLKTSEMTSMTKTRPQSPLPARAPARSGPMAAPTLKWPDSRKRQLVRHLIENASLFRKTNVLEIRPASAVNDRRDSCKRFARPPDQRFQCIINILTWVMDADPAQQKQQLWSERMVLTYKIFSELYGASTKWVRYWPLTRMPVNRVRKMFQLKQELWMGSPWLDLIGHLV